MKSDKEIQHDVMAELAWEPSIDAASIGVSVSHGKVTLSGQVKYYSEKLTAEKAAKRVRGVSDVNLDIKVVPAEEVTTDPEITNKILLALDWNHKIPNKNLQVRVERGWVYLSGEVDWLFQKWTAETVISNLPGVRGVTNLIRVKSRIDSVHVRESIKNALERNADLEAAKINIETSGSKVILSGTTRSWLQRKSIAIAAASAPGVTEVDDQMSVTG